MNNESTDLTDVAIEQVETIAEGTEIQIRVERISRKRERGRRLMSEPRVGCLLVHVQCIIVDVQCCRLMRTDWESKW